MNSDKAEKYIYFLWASVIFLNLLFKSGWNTWTQTLSFYLTLIAFIPLLRSGLDLKIKFTGFLVLTFVFTLISYFSIEKTALTDIIFAGWINYILFFMLGAGYLSKIKEKTTRQIAAICIWAAVLDLIYPFSFNTPLFPNPNIKAGFFILTAPFLMYIIKESFRLNKQESFMWMAGGGIVVFSFITASSRWGFIVMGMSMAIWLFLNNMKKAAAALTAAGAAALIFFLNFYSLLIAASARIEWLAAGIRMIARRPTTGFGPGSTPHVLPSFSAGGAAMHFTHYIHSYFIQFAAEFGLPAVLCLIVFLFLSVKRIFLSGNNLDKTAAAAVFFLIIYNLLEYNLAIPLVGLLFFSIAGTFFPGKHLRVAAAGKTHKAFAAFASVILVAGGAVFVTRPFLANRHFSRGMYKLSISKFRDASAFFEKSLKIYPACGLSSLGLAVIETGKGNLLEAEELISRSIPVMETPNPAVKALQSAKEARIDGDYDRAADKYMESIRMRFTQFGYRYRLELPDKSTFL